LPTIAQKFLAPAVQHLSEHILYFYVTHMVDYTSQAAGMDTGKIARLHHKNKEVSTELDKTLAAASKQVIMAVNQAFQQVPQIIQQAMQQLQQMSQPQMQPDPTAMQVANIRAQAQQATNQSREKIAGLQQQGTQQKTQADNQTTLQQTQVQEAGETQRTLEEIAERERINAEDNATALEIAAAKIETGHSTNISTGTGIEGHESPGAEGKGA
jgi:hypothetical protein